MKSSFATIVITASLLLPFGGGAETFVVTPGSLGRSVTIGSEVSEIILSGAVNASDLAYINTPGRRLDLLDLSGVTVEAYSGDPYTAHITHAPAATLPAYSLSGLDAAKVILPPSVTAIGDGALMGSSIQTLDIPPGVTSIGASAFAGCSSLRSVIIPATVTGCGRGVLRDCTDLRQLYWFSSADLPNHAAAGCTSLSEAYISQVTAIGTGAFEGDTALGAITFSSRLTHLGATCFAGSGLTSVDLSHCSSLKEIGAYAFSGCPDLGSVRLPLSLGRMGEGVFFNSSSLRSVVMPRSLEALPALTFCGAGTLAEDSGLIPDGTETVGTLSLAGLGGISAVTLPSSLRHIADGAFEGWLGLSEIDATTLPVVPTLGSDVWVGVAADDTRLKVRDTLADLFRAAPQWREFDIVTGESGLTHLTPDTPAATPLEVRFDGDILIVSSSEPMTSAILAEPDGTVADTLSTPEGATEYRIDTSARQGRIYILGAGMLRGGRASAKLIRPQR